MPSARRKHGLATDIDRDALVDLQDLPNVGPATAGDLRLLGITHPRDLRGQDPYGMYTELCTRTGTRHDPCVIDVFLAAVRFMEGDPARPWWHYTPERKREIAAHPLPGG